MCTALVKAERNNIAKNKDFKRQMQRETGSTNWLRASLKSHTLILAFIFYIETKTEILEILEEGTF